MIKNILFFFLSGVITIFGSEQEIVALFQQCHGNKVTIQAGVAPRILLKSQSDGNLIQTRQVKCVYTDLEAAVGFSIPGVQEQMKQGLKFVDYMVSDHALFDRFFRYANDRYYLLQDSHLENVMQRYLESVEVKDLAALTVMIKTLDLFRNYNLIKNSA